MQAEDRIIHFSTELVHAPSPPNKEALQQLYIDLSKTRHASYDSTDFGNPMQPKLYSRRGQKTQSIGLFLPDRVLLVEEWTDIALSDFLEKVHDVGLKAMGARNVTQYLAHTATIRSTFALTHYEDARVFLIDHMCGQEGFIAPHFQRPMAVGGLKFVLPETNEHPGSFNVQIESFRHSRNEIFVEVKGIFGRKRTDASSLDLVLENIRSVRNFVSNQVFPYLNQFDQPRDAVE